MAIAADLHLTNEGGDFDKMREYGIKPYYFPMDVSSKEFNRVLIDPTGPAVLQPVQKVHNISFFGSHIGVGDRLEWLKIINQKFPVKIWAPDYEAWKKDGFEAYPAVWGNDFALEVAKSKIVLGFNVNDHCWGYWSNRVGKVLTVGGFLLQRYVPGMELFLRDGVGYFSTSDEAIAKIDFYLKNDDIRSKIAHRGLEIGRNNFTSKARMQELIILIDRYLKGGLDGC
jgi:spore maturation protein CgeB